MTSDEIRKVHIEVENAIKKTIDETYTNGNKDEITEYPAGSLSEFTIKMSRENPNKTLEIVTMGSIICTNIAKYVAQKELMARFGR